MTAKIQQQLLDVCQKSPIGPKWILAASRRTAIQWKDQLNLAGNSTVNLHVQTLKSAVLDLATPSLLTESLEFAGDVRATLVVGEVFSQVAAAGRLKYLNRTQLTPHISPQLAQLVARTVFDLRLADTQGEVAQFDAAFDAPGKAADLRLIKAGYEQRLTELKLVDYADCLHLAIERVQTHGEDSPPDLPADLIVVCPLEIAEVAGSYLERSFLEKLSAVCEFVPPVVSPRPASWNFNAEFRVTNGEINEIQLLLQDVLRGTDSQPSLPLDHVEILHTDYATYVPLVHETLTAMLGEDCKSIDDLPATFGEGIACIYSRPGRALRSFLRWFRHDCGQSLLVQMVREGLLEFERDNASSVSFVQLAHQLRKLPIGFSAGRYVPQLQAAIADAQHRQQLAAKRAADGETPETSPGYDFGESTLQTLLVTLEPMLAGAPKLTSTPLQVLTAARKFLVGFARTASKLDEYAKAKLLDDIAAMQLALQHSPAAVHNVLNVLNVWDWLEQLPVESRILASGPRPGCLHVDHVARGGHSGRANVYLLGLDDRRFSQRGSQDPLLLDRERDELSSRLACELTTSTERTARSVTNFQSLLDRLHEIQANVTFSYAAYSLAADREQFPSSALLDIFRRCTGAPAAALDDFLRELGEPASFCGEDSSKLVHADQWWQTQLACHDDLTARLTLVESEFDHWQAGRLAEAQRALAAFTQFDGNVPEAGADLDPSVKSTSLGTVKPTRVSPSQLEAFGACPRRYFFRYGLGITPPDEHDVDPEQWLDPLAIGSLLHEVFEEFLRELTAASQIPDFQRDLSRLRQLLQDKIDALKQVIPIPNRDVYERQRRHLEKTCETFLRREESHCLETGAVPWVFEASIGLGDQPQTAVDQCEPVTLTLSDGRQICVGGRIDRIDRIGPIGDESSLQFAIWDYKTGSAWGFAQEDPFKQGRKLQPFLYAGMLRHRLKASVNAAAEVSYFGYFFPSPKTDGLRLSWTSGELKSGDAILRQICDAIAAGAFIATENKQDCTYCDYQPICGSPTATAASSRMQLQLADNTTLDPVRSLRGVEVEVDLDAIEEGELDDQE